MTSTEIRPSAAARPRVHRRPWVLIGLEVFASGSAVYGGVGLMADNVLGMPDEWLHGTPFGSWVLPGLFLLLVVAVPMGLAGVLELRRSAAAAVASVLAGAALIGWIGVELLVVQRYNVLQPVMTGVGLAVLLLAVGVHCPQVLPVRSAGRR